MKHCGTQSIETERLVLRRFSIDDAEAMYRNWASDPEVTKYLNPHSGMVMQKCGMKYEGTMRSSDRNNQGICDTCWYALLKTDR